MSKRAERHEGAGASAPASPSERVVTSFPSERQWTAIAAGVFLICLMEIFHPLVGQDPRDHVLVTNPVVSPGGGDGYPGLSFEGADHRFAVAVVARNAHALLSDPIDLMDAEMCFPVARALALGEPAVTLGLLGLPAWLVSGDPILTFNFAVMLLAFISAMAMYRLIADLTHEPLAAIAAGVLYAFHALRMSDLIHVFIYESAWTVLALYFARRLFLQGRWRDAIGLALCCALQVGGSLYALLGAAVIGLAALVWLVATQGFARVRPAQLACVAVVLLGASFFVLGPFLELRAEGVLSDRSLQVYRPHHWILPGGAGFSGWLCWLLVAAAWLHPARRSAGPGPDTGVRWALLASALLIGLAAVVVGGSPGDDTLAIVHGEGTPQSAFGLHLWLSRFVPGLDVVRSPGAIYPGVHLALTALAGLGAAALLGAVPARRRAVVGIGLVALVWVETLRPPLPGLQPRVVYASYGLRPEQPALDFFAELATLGATGPYMELPSTPRNPLRQSRAVLLSAYHHERTNHCYNSYHPPIVAEVRGMGGALPDSDALASLSTLGFETLVVHRPRGQRESMASAVQRIEIAARAGVLGLERVHESDYATAYRMPPAPSAAANAAAAR